MYDKLNQTESTELRVSAGRGQGSPLSGLRKYRAESEHTEEMANSKNPQPTSKNPHLHIKLLLSGLQGLTGKAICMNADCDNPKMPR